MCKVKGEVLERIPVVHVMVLDCVEALVSVVKSMQQAHDQVGKVWEKWTDLIT